MKKDIETIRNNLDHASRREKAQKSSKKLWISRMLRIASEDEGLSYSKTAELLGEVGALSVDDVLCAASVMIGEDTLEIHGDISFEQQKEKPFTVSNFKSDLSIQTYKKFFQDKEFTIIERESFIELFEDVYSERSNYCIVPIENTTSGKLSNFYSLISNYNLKIVKVCDIEHSGQDASTRFALLSSAPISITSPERRPCYFEVSISCNNENSLSRALEAASKCGMLPKRIDSVPFTHLKGEYSYQIVFRMEHDALFLNFLIFLSIEGISFTPIGIFE